MENPHPLSVAALLQGLVEDVRVLFGQTMRLARDEIRLERQKVMGLLLRAGIGLLLACMTGLMLLLAVVHLLHHALNLPLWTSYGLVGLLCAFIAGWLLASAASLGATLRLWPFRTFHSIKEDARWIKEQMLSTKM
ncbi:MAG: phage holin family protein [Nitrospira sp.]|nr:phage holin family protein [Nitrospira sp.]